MNYEVITLYKKGEPITDFALERNLLLEKAKTEWVLFLDSDEKMSGELTNEILKQVQDDKYQGYKIKRIDWFMGKWLKYGETGDIWLLRFGKKSAGKWKRKVHEYWDIKNVGKLKWTILHYPKWSITKINQYSEVDAQEFGKFEYWQLVKPVAKFILNYFFKLGFLDGKAGFIHAYLMALQSLIVRVKQYERSLSC